MWVGSVYLIIDMEKKNPIFIWGILALFFGQVLSDCEIAEPCDRAACDELGPENCHCSGDETDVPMSDRPMVSCYFL